MPVNLFDANFYRAANADLRGFSDVQALSHFQTYGLNEGRQFSPLVDLSFYRSSNGDLAKFNNQQIFNHLQDFGISEGRSFSQVTSLSFYRFANSDLASFSNQQLFEHLRLYGVGEGRIFSQSFDANFYLAINSDIAQAYVGSKTSALQHFELNGLTEGRQSSLNFNVSYYRAINSDLALSNLNNKQLLEHFQRFGIDEGRITSETFNVRTYLSYNSDLASAGMNYRQASEHFIQYGRWEGRQASSLINSDHAGNTFDLARDVFFDNNSVVLRDSIQSSDPSDFYRFNLSAQRGSSFRLQLNGLTSDLNVELYNSNRQLILQSSNASNMSESLSKNLAAGAYYIKIYPIGTGLASNYNLSVSTASLSTGNYFADRVVDLTNAQRVQFGLAPLMLQLQLTSAAQTHSQNMALSDFFSHTGNDGSSSVSRAQGVGYPSSYVGENIAAGYATPEEVIQGWMNSSGHRQNILNTSYQEIGVGYYYLANDSGQVNYKSYWTQDFGTVF